MIVGEYGKRLILQTAYNVSGNVGDDGLQMELTKPDGTFVEFNKASANPVTLGATADTVTDEKGRQYSLAANQYIYRDWASGDLNQAGTYKVRAVYQDSTKELRSKQVCFSVCP